MIISCAFRFLIVVRKLQRFRFGNYVLVCEDPARTGVNNLDAIDLVVVSNLIQLGRHHATIAGFKIEYMDAFRAAMTDVWEAEIGRKQFTGPTEKAWSKLFRVISNSVLEGYQQRSSELKYTRPRDVQNPDKNRLNFDDVVSDAMNLDLADESYDFDDETA